LRKLLLGGALVGALSVGLAAVAPAAINQGQEFDLSYTTKRPDFHSGITARLDNAGTRDATGKPKAARRVRITFPRGTTFDTSVRPRCSRSTLQSRGPSGCPRGSQVGSGNAEAVTGLTTIDPVEVSIRAFNSNPSILLYIQSKPGEPSATLIIPLTIRRNVATATVPRLPQPTPFGEAILTEFMVRINDIRRGSKELIETGACPRTAKWVTTAVFTYDSGSTTVRDNSPCRRS
jgi:hypothetical protein